MKNFQERAIKIIFVKNVAEKPKDEIDLAEEIFNYLRQSNISKKNISRLQKLACSQNQELSEMAKIVLEVARIKPHKKRRLKFLAKENRELLAQLETSGLIIAHHWLSIKKLKSHIRALNSTGTYAAFGPGFCPTS